MGSRLIARSTGGGRGRDGSGRGGTGASRSRTLAVTADRFVIACSASGAGGAALVHCFADTAPPYGVHRDRRFSSLPISRPSRVGVCGGGVVEASAAGGSATGGGAGDGGTGPDGEPVSRSPLPRSVVGADGAAVAAVPRATTAGRTGMGARAVVVSARPRTVMSVACTCPTVGRAAGSSSSIRSTRSTTDDGAERGSSRSLSPCSTAIEGSWCAGSNRGTRPVRYSA